MPDDLETSLARVLHRVGETTPEPGPGLAGALLREHRQRTEHRTSIRSRLVAAAAALAVLIVLAAGVTAIRELRGDQGTRPATRPTNVVHTDYRNGAPLTDVWPAAARRVPSVLPGQSARATIVRTLSAGRLLVMTTEDQGNANRLWIWDPAGGSLTAINPKFQHVELVAQPVNAEGEKWIVWAGHDEASGAVFLWYVPSTGGAYRKISEERFVYFPDLTKPHSLLNDYRLLIKDDMVVVDTPSYTVPAKGSRPVTALPLRGGVTVTFAGTTGYRVLDWPWLTPVASKTNETIWNVDTGERRTAPVRGWTHVSCSLSWCSGIANGALVAARRDGSHVRQLADRSGEYGPAILLDRFVIAAPGPGGWIYDLRAGST